MALIVQITISMIIRIVNKTSGQRGSPNNIGEPFIIVQMVTAYILTLINIV